MLTLARNNSISTFQQIYKGTLEDEFNDFSDLITSFPLYRGKGKRDPNNPKGQVVGLLKGSVKRYSIPDGDESKEPKYLVTLPPTDPVKVLVRVYIVRVSDKGSYVVF